MGVETALDGTVLRIQMKHGKANALDVELVLELDRALAAAEGSGARAVLLTGAGNSFCAGVDLVRLLAEDGRYLAEFLPATRQLLQRLFFLPLPVVAAVNGHAVAGGCVLACACDHAFGAAGAKVGVAEILVGLAFPAVALEILRSAVPPDRFREVVYSGRLYPMEDGVACGFVDEVLRPADVAGRAGEVARSLAEYSQEAFRLTKRQMRQPVRRFLEADGAGIDAAVERQWRSPEAREALQRYVASVLGKEPPGAGGRAG